MSAENYNKSADSIRYYPINEDTARRAKNANSFSDYIPGSATAEYRRCVDEAAEIAQRQKNRVAPEYHGKIDGLLDAYARKLADNMNESYSIVGCPLKSVDIRTQCAYNISTKGCHQ